jgi:hypothetical protein
MDLVLTGGQRAPVRVEEMPVSPGWLAETGIAPLLAEMGMTGVERPQKTKHLIMFMHDALKAAGLRHHLRQERRSRALATFLLTTARRCRAALGLAFREWLFAHARDLEYRALRAELSRVEREKAMVAKAKEAAEAERTQRNLQQARLTQALAHRRLTLARGIADRVRLQAGSG